MSLSNLRRSLSSIKTLARATGAMRVLSMSSSSAIKNEIDTLLKSLDSLNELKETYKFSPKYKEDVKNVYIFVGSEKGLCGSYNNELKTEFLKFLSSLKFESSRDKLILVGRKLINTLKKFDLPEKVIFFEKFTRKSFFEVKNKILFESSVFSKISFYYVNSKTLFNRSFKKKEIYSDFELNTENLFLGHFSKEKILESFLKIYKESSINFILKSALYSEEASRFISMDAAYTNAKKIIKEKELFYNKKRQSIITNSSLDLIGNWVQF